MSQPIRTSSEMVGFQQTAPLPADQPHDLLRLMWWSMDSPSGHKPGVLVWLEPKPLLAPEESPSH